MSLTPKTNIPSLFKETRVGLTPRADYHIANTVTTDVSQELDIVPVPERVAQRIKQTINNPANKGVNS